MILYIFQLNEKSGSYRVKTLPTDAKGLKIVSDLTFYAGSDNQRLTCRICKCSNIRRHHLFIYSFIHLFIYSFIHLFIYSFIHSAGPDGSFGSGSKLKDTVFASWSGRMFVIRVVHILCTNYSKAWSVQLCIWH